MKEIDIQNKIRLGVNDLAIMFNTSIGSTIKRGDAFIRTGLVKGHSDLTGVRRSDGKAIFIEVKKPKGSVVYEEQKNFLKQMKKANAIAGICRSVEDARRLINEEIEGEI